MTVRPRSTPPEIRAPEPHHGAKISLEPAVLAVVPARPKLRRIDAAWHAKELDVEGTSRRLRGLEQAPHAVARLAVDGLLQVVE